MLESELFGHKKGSFTGAVQDRKGLFQAAEGGTLFLDEIGDMPLRAAGQAAARAGGTGGAPGRRATRSIAVNVRVISATHRKLEERIASGEFREDLFYRLSVVKLGAAGACGAARGHPAAGGPFPAAMSRNATTGRGSRCSPEAMELLVAAPWPGNVRQLLNVIEQAVALSATDVIPASLVRQALDAGDSTLTPLDEARRAFERDYLARILKITAGNVTQAARLAGRNRTEFYRLLDRHALEPAMFKVSPRADNESRAESSASRARG